MLSMILAVALGQTIQDCGNGSYQIQNDPRPRLTVASYLDSAQEGDLILGAKDSRALQTIFRRATGSSITHVAIVVRHDSDLRVLDASPGQKVGLYEIKDYLYDYRGAICVKRRVGPAPPPELGQFAKKQIGRPYSRLKELAKVPFSLPLIRDIESLQDLGDGVSWFCSSLTTAAAQIGGWIDRSINPQAIRPVDMFLSDNPNWEIAQLLHRV